MSEIETGSFWFGLIVGATSATLIILAFVALFASEGKDPYES